MTRQSRPIISILGVSARGSRASRGRGWARPWKQRQFPIGIISAPGYRYHPAVLAQAAATIGEMYEGRLWLALGSGEAINEAITGAVLAGQERAQRAFARMCRDHAAAICGRDGHASRARNGGRSQALFATPHARAALRRGDVGEDGSSRWRMGRWTSPGRIPSREREAADRRVPKPWRRRQAGACADGRELGTNAESGGQIMLSSSGPPRPSAEKSRGTSVDLLTSTWRRAL